MRIINKFFDDNGNFECRFRAWDDNGEKILDTDKPEEFGVFLRQLRAESMKEKMQEHPVNENTDVEKNAEAEAVATASTNAVSDDHGNESNDGFVCDSCGDCGKCIDGEECELSVEAIPIRHAVLGVLAASALVASAAAAGVTALFNVFRGR